MRHMLRDLLWMLTKQPKMRSAITRTAIGLVLSLGLVETVLAQDCPKDSVAAGQVCIDKYEASVWYVPPEQTSVRDKIRKGDVTLKDLQDAGAVQLGLTDRDLEEAGCPPGGGGCVDFYAVSIPGVLPAVFLDWFQAVAFARNSLKRLPTNQEWQAAALGTPDGLPCNVSSSGIANTGTPGCESDVGAFDMVGNVGERVADWSDRATGCQNWRPSLGSDLSCFGDGAAGSDPSHLPGVLRRGGQWDAGPLSGGGTEAGAFAVDARGFPAAIGPSSGFRCARNMKPL